MSTQVLNISPNSSLLGTPLHRAIDLAVRAFFLLFNLTFPCLHFIPFVFGNDLDKRVLTFENKKPCLCLQLRFPDPSTYGNFRDLGGRGRAARKQADVGSPRSHVKGPNPRDLSPQVDEKRVTCLQSLQVTWGPILGGGGDRHRVFWAARSLTASWRRGWDRRWQQSIRLCGPGGPG